MTTEARLAYLVLFFAAWCFFGLISWAVAAVIVRGRGALLALPLALGGAAAAGVSVPLAGLDDATGFFFSLAAALSGGAVGAATGVAFARRLTPTQSSRAADRPNEPRRHKDHQG